MDAAVVLAAVFVGWLLGFGQQASRDRREGQLATRLLIHELGINKMELKSREEHLAWAAYRPMSFRTWEAYAPVILRAIDFESMHAVLMAHLSIQHADELSRLIVSTRERTKRLPRDKQAEAERLLEGTEESAKEAVAEVVERVDLATAMLVGQAHETFPRYLRRVSRASFQRVVKALGRGNSEGGPP